MDLKEKEKKRTLSEAEKRRLENFNDVCYDLKKQGYRSAELTISIVKANIFAFVFAIPVFVTGFVLFIMKNRQVSLSLSPREMLLFIADLLVLTLVHEFLHGLVWGMYSEHYYKDIEFGFMKQYMTPYCTCTMPLRKGPYVAGALAPLIALGILPVIASIFNGSYMMLLLGLIMTVGAAGDIMIVYKLLTYHTSSGDVVYLDHPTMGGMVVFERDQH